MRAKLLATTALAGMLVATPVAKAQFAVIDVANLQQNVQQTLQQVVELIRLLTQIELLIQQVTGTDISITAPPGYITTIALEPGEQLVNYAVGDTARWVVGDVIKGDQTLLLVKPTKPKLSTNLVITTDRRIYLFEASSHKGATYNASIAWTYPLDSLSRQVAAIDVANDRNADTIIAGVPLDQLNFDYAIEGDKPHGGSGPRWRSIRAFDDGAKVYIEFPRDLATSEAPPLFVTDEGGAGQLVNYRAKERYYVVDRLFDFAELRLDDTVVRISKNGAGGFSCKRWLTKPSERTSLRRDPDDHGENRDQHDRTEPHGGGNHGMDGKHGT